MRCMRLKKGKARRQRLKKPHDAKQSERRCVATGETLFPETGLRFVLGPDGALAPDFTGKLPGRGAWLTPSRPALEAALRKGAFARSFKAPARAPEDLAERVEAGLAKAALSALGLARKAGDTVLGFEKVRAALKGGEIAVLVNARDGGADGRRKLEGLAGGVDLVEVFTVDELSAALGRDEPAVHIGLKKGPAAQRFLREARRAEGFRAARAGKMEEAGRNLAKTG